MNRFEKRRMKQNIYRHANAIMYTAIFVIASVITIVAAVNRNDDVAYVDESQLTVASKEFIGVDNGESVKVAAADTSQEDADETTEVVSTGENVNQTRVKVTADSLVVRSEQSQESEPLGTVSENQIIEFTNVYEEWIEINFEGTVGYINAAYVEFIE